MRMAPKETQRPPHRRQRLRRLPLLLRRRRAHGGDAHGARVLARVRDHVLREPRVHGGLCAR